MKMKYQMSSTMPYFLSCHENSFSDELVISEQDALVIYQSPTVEVRRYNEENHSREQTEGGIDETCEKEAATEHLFADMLF